MKAYDVKHGTKVIVNECHEITMDKLDGMYCSGIDENGNRIYIAAWTEVEPCVKE